MRHLPTGTVTFLFTDIEGSTRLLHELGDEYGEVLSDHHRILREVFSRHRGVEVSTEGDAFFVAFSSVPDAVNAAAQAQLELARHHAEGGADVRVRMGLHTGEAELVADNYGGLDVHRAARISSVAHGGQILLSGATAQHAQSSPKISGNVRVLDLGKYRLKDLDEPEHLFQLCIDGLRADFPAPRAAGTFMHLPIYLNEFVARDREVREVGRLLTSNRLVTLTGPGGTGKTRLAVEVARTVGDDFPDGVFFVELAPIADVELVPTTIAETLSLREEGSRPVIETLKDHLSGKQELLLLDNFEQIVPAGPLVADLLRTASGLKVVVTSRAALRVAGEQEYPVPPMAMPDPERLPDVEMLTEYESIQLFMQRARALKPDFALTESNADVIARICVKLDGLPLAIELAAARVRLLSPQEILTRLDRSLAILSGGASDVPQRQRTLTNLIGWSYDLLDDGHQALFRSLAVFVGGWSLEAAEAICDPDGDLGVDVIDGLELLVGSSLVRVSHPLEEETRFRMLETIREYALEALTRSGEHDELSRRHAAYFVDMAKKAEPHILSQEGEWADRLTAEHDNLRAALRLLIDVHAATDGLVLAKCLWRFWQIRSHLAEGRMWLTELLSLPESNEDPVVRAQALGALGSITYWQNDFAATREYYSAALEAQRSTNDPAGLAEALYNMGFLDLIEHNSVEARGFYTQSLELYREIHNSLGEAYAKWGIAFSHLQERNLDTARALGLEALEAFKAHRNYFGVQLGQYIEFQVERFAGNYAKSRELLVEMLQDPEAKKDISGLSSWVELLGDVEIAMGRPRRGLRLAAAGSALRTEYGGGAPPPLLEMEDPMKLVSGVLTETEVEENWQEGLQMSPDEILAYALKDPEIED
jgi:predicted ATPase/class 3 adenylate cyclase